MKEIYCIVCRNTFRKSHNVPNLELDLKDKRRRLFDSPGQPSNANSLKGRLYLNRPL